MNLTVFVGDRLRERPLVVLEVDNLEDHSTMVHSVQ